MVEISKYKSLGAGDVVWFRANDRLWTMKLGGLIEIEVSGVGTPRDKVVGG